MSEAYEYDSESFRIRWISTTSVHLQKRNLQNEGYVCFDLGPCMTKNEFLESLRCSLALPCSESSLTSWDSAADFFWQAMMEQPGTKVAIIWDSVDLLVDSKLALLTKCLEFLVSVAEVVERPEFSSDCHPVLVQIYLVGEGSNFPSITSKEASTQKGN
jgi:hypothetical protein